MTKYIILDRDGVINYESTAYIKSPDEWLPIPGSLEAIALLTKRDYKIIIVTNQSGVGRGYYTEETLFLIHQKLITLTSDKGGKITAIYYCPHHPDVGCLCRKPEIGLLLKASKEHPIDFSKTFFIGDNLTDIEAAKKVGCKPLLVLTGKGALTLKNEPSLTTPSFLDLAHAVSYVLQEA